MMIGKWITALAAASLAATPAVAETTRAPAPVEQADNLAGGAGAAWILAALVVVALIVAITSDDDDIDLPHSP